MHIRILNKFKGLWGVSSNVGQQTTRSALFILSTRIFIKAVQFIRTVVLARLLFPADFGLFGLAALTMAFANTFIQTGFDSALIHEKKDITPYLNGAWSATVIRNAFLAVVVFLIAPWAGTFFNNTEVISLIRAMALSVFVTGLANVGVVLFQKNLEFHKRFLLDSATVLGEVVITIGAALMLQNAWALVIGAISGRILYVVLSFHIHPYRPKFELDWPAVKHLFRYGKWVGLGSIIVFFSSQGDYFAIGKLLSPEELGVYQLAFGLSLLPAVELARAPGSLFFALFSKIQDDKVFLRRAFIKITSLIAMIALPASMGLWWLSEEIVAHIYGARWSSMIGVIGPLIVYGACKAAEYSISPLFYGIGRPKVVTAAQSIQLVVMALILIPLTLAWGIRGTALAMVSSGFLTVLVLALVLRKQINLGWRGLMEIIQLPLISTLIMLLILQWSWRPLATIFNVHGLVYVGVGVVFGAVFYFAVLLILDNLFNRNKFLDAFIWIKTNL